MNDKIIDQIKILDILEHAVQSHSQNISEAPT